MPEGALLVRVMVWVVAAEPIPCAGKIRDAGEKRIGCVQVVAPPTARQTFPMSPSRVPPGQRKCHSVAVGALQNCAGAACCALKIDRRRIGKARGSADLADDLTLVRDQLQNNGRAADLAVNRSGYQAGIALKIQRAGDGRIARPNVGALRQIPETAKS